MATAFEKTSIPGDGTWHDVAGTAASVAGVTWQNIGSTTLLIAFTENEPGAADAWHVLNPGEAWYDVTGSATVWVKAADGGVIAATGD